MIEISIIVPVYKAGKHIERCIRSILNQSFEKFELILVDDGSPDNSGEICDMFAKQDQRIKVVHKENGGVSSARNKGLEVAQGKYIMFCDSDDYVDHDWCQEMYNLVIQKKVSLAICGYKSIDFESNTINFEQKYSDESSIVVSRTELWNIYSHKLINIPWNKIYLAEVISNNNIRFDESLQYGEDVLFVLEYIRKSRGDIGILNATPYYYIQGIVGSLSNRYIPNFWSTWKRVFSEIEQVLIECKVDFESIQDDYYSKWVWIVNAAINNNEKHDSGMNIAAIWKENKAILASEECKVAFKKGSFKEYHPVYALVARRRSYILIILFKGLVKFKNIFT